MTRRRRLDPDEVVPGQFDIDGGVLEAMQPARLPRARTELRPGDPVQYVEQKLKRVDCDACFAEQVEANEQGRPAPHRKRAVWIRESYGEKPMYLCAAHGQTKASLDGGFFSRPR